MLIAPAGFCADGQPEVIVRDRLVYVADPANPRLRDGRSHRRGPAGAAARGRPAAAPARPGHGARSSGLGITPNVVVTTGGWLPLAFLVAGTDLVAAVPERLARRVSAAAGVTVTEPPFGTIELTEAAWWHPMRATDPALTWLRTISAAPGVTARGRGHLRPTRSTSSVIS